MFLELRDLVVKYGQSTAVKGISLEVQEGTVVTLLGPNGAGKTTTLRTVSGLQRPAAGEIRFDGQRIDGMAPERIVKAGVAHVPEGRRVFPEMSVLHNLYTGAYLRHDKAGIARDLESVFGHFPVLRERRSQLAKYLSGGEQQMLAMGRALMSGPRLLLLDEPSLGLAPVMVQEIFRIIVEINQRGVGVVLVEQNAELALGLARYGYVLETGNIALEGEASLLKANEHVRRAYLGM